MFLYRIMPIMDMAAAFLIIFGPAAPALALRVFAGYLVGKGLFFTVISKDVPSAIDFIIGLYAFAIVFFGWYSLLASIISFAFLAQKSVFGLAR